MDPSKIRPVRFGKWRRALLGAASGAATLFAASAVSATNPVVPEVVGCEPVFQGAASDSSCSGVGTGNMTAAVPCTTDADCSSLPGGGMVCGASGTCVNRVFNFYFGLRTSNKADAVADALAATTCIDICFEDDGQPVGTPPTCPGDSWCDPSGGGAPDPAGKPFVIYDSVHGISNLRDVNGNAIADITKVSVFQDPTAMNSDLALLWTLPADESVFARGFTVRVNAGSPLGAVSGSGSCLTWAKLADDGAAQPRFEVWASPASQLANLAADTSQWHPFGPGQDVCQKGSRVLFASGVTAGTEDCATSAQAQYLATFFDAIDDAQQQRLQNTSGVGVHKSWTNGTVGGTCQPTRVLIGTHPGGWGQAGTGAFHMNGPETTCLLPDPNPKTAAMSNGCGGGDPGGLDLYRLAAHEYLHQFQGKWSADKPNASAFINSVVVSENTADLVSYHLCLPTLTGPGGAQCWSGIKVASPQTTLGDSNATFYEIYPNIDLLYKPYAGAAFFHYVSEQFSYPIGTKAHPSGTQSGIERPAAPADSPFRLQGRPSDEGMDFLGLMFKDFEGATNGQSVESAIDASLKTHLGRSLDDVVFDMHTALYLKDYNAKDSFSSRWRFEWVGDGDSPTALDTIKPFFPPKAKPLVDAQDDGHLHAFRVLDDWVSCAPGVDPTTGCVGLCDPATPGCATPRTSLMLNQGIAGSVPVGLTSRSAAAFSVHPDAGWVGAGPIGVTANGTGPKPRFRLFRIRKGTTPAGKTTLTPEPLCPGAPDFECGTIPPADGSKGWMLSQAVSVDATTDEILLIASARTPSVFNWAIGTINPQVTILAPTTTTPTFVGHPSGASGILPFVLEATYRDANGLPVNVTPATSLQVNVPGCAAAPNCTVPTNQVALVPLTGGNVFVTVTLPSSFFPASLASPQFVDLELVIDGVSSGVMPKALKMSQDTELFADTIVIDKSGSMGPSEESGAKIEAARLISKAIAGAYVPADPSKPGSHQLSIVTFNDDADTLPLGPSGEAFVTVDATTIMGIQQQISGISAGGYTSIGDGVFEAQSNLACAFDDATTKPDGQSMIVLTDGLNNRDADPSIYYSGDQGIPSGDGNGTWCLKPLSIPLRKSAGLPVPIISAIGIGQDADLSALTNLAAIGGGALMYIGEPGDIPNIQTEMAILMGDSMFAAANHAHGTQRLFATPLGGDPTPTLFPVDPGAKELRVVLAGPDLADADVAILIPPTGTSPTVQTIRVENGIILKVANPPAGDWAVLPYAPNQTLFVEAAVESSVRLYGFADIANVPSSMGNPLIKSGIRGQDDIYLRAVPMGATALTGCYVAAAVANPAGVVSLHVLHDNGLSADGVDNDGVYGAHYTGTALPGIYDVLFAAVCSTPDGHTIWRQDRRAVVLQPGGDTDHDGLPDLWEKTHNLNPNDASDALADPDHDGLTNLAEFAATTDPHESDTDGGGESDGSEVAAGRDPRDPSDDKIKTIWPYAIGGNGKLFLHLAGNYSQYDLFVERQLSDGTFSPDPVLIVRGTGVFDGGDLPPIDVDVLPVVPPVTAVELGAAQNVQNGVTSCFRVRSALGSATSGWSEVTCATPGPDPNPPTLIATHPVIAHSRQVTLPLIATDELPHHVRALNLPLDVRSTGVTMIRIGNSPTISDGSWVPFSTSVRLPDSTTSGVWVQVRDASGNVSDAVRVDVRRFPNSLLDQAIALEETAQDQSAAQSWTAARISIKASVPKIAHTLEEVLEQHPAPPIVKHMTEAVAAILEHKAHAAAWMDAKHHAQADAELASALSLERDLAAWADANGVSFVETGP